MSGWTLTNYWLLIAWIACAGFFLQILFPLVPVRILGRIEYRWNLLAAFIMGIPLVIWAGYRPNSIGDTAGYRANFREAPHVLEAMKDYVSSGSKDQGFRAFLVVCKSVVGDSDVAFFIIIAAIQIICIFWVLRKYSCAFLFSVFMFIASCDYVGWTFNGIRQFLAVCCIFACAGLIIKRRFIPLLILILLFSTIHGSALIMIPIVIASMGKAWNRRTLLIIVVILFSILFLDQFTAVLDIITTNTQYEGYTQNAEWLRDNGTNPLRVLMHSVPALLALCGRRYVKEADDPVIHVCVNMSIISAGLYLLSMFTSGILMGRLPIYASMFSYISLPWLIQNCFSRSSAKVIYGLAIIGYTVFFWLQMSRWGLL